MDETLRVKTLVKVAAMDAYQARLVAIRPTPTILARMEPDRAAEVVSALEIEGVSAIAPQRDDIWNFRTTPRVRSLTLTSPGIYSILFWDGRITELKMRDVVFMVRGRVQRSSTRTESNSASAGSVAAGYMIGGVFGAAMAASTGGGATRSTKIELSHLLDLFVRNGTRVRLNADKFSFDVLGPDKGFTNIENMDKLAVQLGRDAPAALIDTDFPKFKPPAEILRDSFQAVGDKGVTRSDDSPAFDFYSAWLYLVNKHLGSFQPPSP